MLLRVGSDAFVLAVLSASKTIDFNKIGALAAGDGKKKRAQMATVPEVWQATRCLPGAVPPFGSLFGIATWVDVSLDAQQGINFNIGLRTESCAMDLTEYLAIEKPQRGDFARS